MIDFFALVLWILGGAFIIFFGFISFIGAPYVPSHRRNVHKIFTELYPVSEQDTVLDIGSGDGVVLREVAKIGGRGVGYELNIFLVIISRLLCRKFGDKIHIVLCDFWRTQFPDDTSLVYTFGEGRDIKKMYKKVQDEATRLARDIFFVSYAFEVPGQTYTKKSAGGFLYTVSPVK